MTFFSFYKNLEPFKTITQISFFTFLNILLYYAGTQNFFRIMSTISCNHIDGDGRSCRRWWKRGFRANPKSCDERGQLHIYQAPKTFPPPSLSSRATSSNNDNNNNNNNYNNDSKMKTRSSQETTNKANSPVGSASNMVSLEGSIYFWFTFCFASI